VSDCITYILYFNRTKDANLCIQQHFFLNTLKKYCKWTLCSTGNISQTLTILSVWDTKCNLTTVTFQHSYDEQGHGRRALHISVLRGTLVGYSVVQFFSHVVSTYPYVLRWLTSCSRVLLEKLTGLQLVKKFTAFYGTRRFITAFTSACHLSLSWASSIQSIPPVLDDTIRIWPQQAQHVYSTHKIQVTKNIYITACWIRLLPIL
jgi:hypothetical protein